jgi:two-component system phosphate regulon sensor histidine kinase PhoR
VGAGLFTVVIIAAFYVTVKSLLNQKKLSEIKSDFINNMTHEFKTPLATISLAVDALRNEKVQNDKEKTKYFSTIIKEENIRMKQTCGNDLAGRTDGPAGAAAQPHSHCTCMR